MKVIEHLAKATSPFISFEIIPPKRGGQVQELLTVLDELVKYNPPFIDITSHAAEVIYEETPQGSIQMRVKRKRPGTLGICALIQNKYNIDAVPHVICNGFTKEETEDFLIELNFLGIDNVLAIRGDESSYKKKTDFGRSINRYAGDLVQQIAGLNHGKYLEDGLLDAQPMDFCVGIAGYPEKHFEAPNLEVDIKYTLEKAEKGADYIVTQMFFDNRHYFNYVEKSQQLGINIPIIPGIKILTNKSHIFNLPKHFHIDIPSDLAGEVMEAKNEHILDIGIEWAYRQAEELLNRNAPAIHFYIMQNSTPISLLMNKLKL